jgi:hypothetical protein
VPDAMEIVRIVAERISVNSKRGVLGQSDDLDPIPFWLAPRKLCRVFLGLQLHPHARRSQGSMPYPPGHV